MILSMNSTLKLGLMAMTTVMALHAPYAHAERISEYLNSNAVNYCQAFTPGPANTIRNRVVGAENIGPSIAVACNFHSLGSSTGRAERPYQLNVRFENNNPSGTITVTCTLLTVGGGDTYAVTKTTAPFMSGAYNILNWNTADNPTPGATNLSSYFLGINCTLPTGASITRTVLYWFQEDGVGT